jgi:hypothetical protein
MNFDELIAAQKMMSHLPIWHPSPGKHSCEAVAASQNMPR